MAAFDDSFDPDLGAACNRLAAWVEALPEGALIDPASDHPSQTPEPQTAPAAPPVRPAHRPADEKSVTERAEDEAATLGDFA